MRKEYLVLTMVVVVGLAFQSAVNAQPNPDDPDLLCWFTADLSSFLDSNDLPVALGERPDKWLNKGTVHNITGQAHDDEGDWRTTTEVVEVDFGECGLQNVLNFPNKDGFYRLVDASDFHPLALNVDNIMVIAVVEMTGSGRRCYFSNYSNSVNWGWGYNIDMEGGSVRAFTSNGTPESISDWVIGGPGNGYNILSTVVDTATPIKQVISNTVLLGEIGPNGDPCDEPVADFDEMGYDPADTNGASIGTLGALPIDYFYFEGGIAEIIVYGVVDETLRQNTESYLADKYCLGPGCGEWGFFDGDLSRDCDVDLEDFALFARDWLGCTVPLEPGCVNLINP